MKMRKTLMEKMPLLLSRVHRPPEGDGDCETGQQVKALLDGDVGSVWKWEDAEKRLGDAYDKNGFSGWTEVMLKELEAEGELERLKRERLVKGNKPA